MPNFQIERIKRLPIHGGETWQGGWFRIPSLVKDEDGRPYRPWLPIWISVQGRFSGHGELARPHEKNFAAVLTALADLACDRGLAGYRPGVVEVQDSALAEHLSGMLAEAGVKVVAKQELPAVDNYLEEMTESMTEGPVIPGPLTGKGVTVEKLRTFAAAAKVFYEASPWEHLTDEDLIQVESPAAPDGLGCVAVLGSAAQTYGLGFFNSPKDYWSLFGPSGGPESLLESLSGAWSIQFDNIVGLPMPDADLWEDHGLPVASEEAYPCAACIMGHGRARRPDAPELSFLEGVLYALTESTEAEIDSGRWTKRVTLQTGPVDFTLALPELLNPPKPEDLFKRGVTPDRRSMERMSAQMERHFAEHPVEGIDEMKREIGRVFTGRTEEEIEFTPHTPLEQAQDLCFQAFDSRGRRQLQLAKEALEISPDCADAYVILAERTADPEKRAELYQQGVEAGERALGKERFQKDEGNFWNLLDTRSYMRARLGLAHCLDELDRLEEALGHYQALLRLNPNDNQGVRFVLATRLIEVGQDAAALKLLDEFSDRSASSLYCRAVLEFRKSGNSQAAQRALGRARRANPFVPRCLLEFDEDPLELPDSCSPGSQEEAAICAAEVIDAWTSSAGALEWLDVQEQELAKRREKQTRQKKRNKRKK
jgi:tetratricopeptide (TPR) repeat protein